MIFLIVIFSLLLIFTNIKSIIRLNKSNNYIKSNVQKKGNAINKKIYLIIPVMNEVKNIEKSICYFDKMKSYVKVIYVTTSKEKNKATYYGIKKNIDKYKTTNISLINCPNKFGTMANQLNYASKSLKENDIIGIYNIDSFPPKETFGYVLENLTDDTVLQQVSYFDDERSGILKSCQNWQNRWSLIYEMGKYLSNMDLEFKYTIGHGLFLKKSILDKVGYWSENDINEDNEFGFRLLCNEIKIKPIPYLEKADFAKSLKIYIKQQSTWVNGPLYAFSYNKKNKKNFKNILLSLLNFKAFVSWWLFPLCTILMLIFSLIYNIYFFFIILFLIINYITVINYLSIKVLKKYGYIKKKNTINIINDLLFFIIHSFGAYITLYKLITKKNTIRNKYNTEK